MHDERDEGEDGSDGGGDGQCRQPAVLHTAGEDEAAEPDRGDTEDRAGQVESVVGQTLGAVGRHAESHADPGDQGDRGEGAGGADGRPDPGLAKAGFVTRLRDELKTLVEGGKSGWRYHPEPRRAPTPTGG